MTNAQRNEDVLSPRAALAFAATAFAEREAIRIDDTSLSYGQVNDRVRRIGSALAAMGIGRGDVVATLALNSVETVELHYVAALAGIILNPINHRLDRDSIARTLAHGRAHVLIHDRALVDLAVAATAALPVAPKLIELGVDGYDALLARGDPAWPGAVLNDERAPLALNYTSGTTGAPKGVVLHHRGAALQALGNAVAIEWGRAPRYLWIMPIFHSLAYCLPWTLALVGGTQICQRRFEPAGALRLIAKERITHFAAAPTIVEMLLAELGGRRVAGEPTVILAGAAPSADLIARMRSAGFGAIHAYGSTETFGAVTINLDPDPAHAHRQGIAYPTVGGLKIVHPGTRDAVPEDGVTPGEVLTAGPTVMAGYLDDLTATAAAMPDGWFAMGDVAVVHPGGAIEIVDRVKDIIISGGENVSSVEVESVLRSHPAIADVAVVARPHPRWGETPCAFVELVPGGDASAEALIDWARERLAGFKVPRAVVFGPLPRTATGKVQKPVLRDRARALQDRDAPRKT